MKIQPLEFHEDEIRNEIDNGNGSKVVKSRLKRLFDRQFQRVLKIGENSGGGAAAEAEPSSVCLAKMVQNFIEENNSDKQQHLNSAKCGRSRCSCFKASNNDIIDEVDQVDVPCNQSIDLLKSLVPSQSLAERNILAETSKNFDKNKLHKRKDEEMRRVVAECLVSLGYDASVVKSRWDKSPSHPAGEYEYIDAIMDEGRILIDMDFRSEFQIARPTGSYKSLLQTLPFIFVGKSDRLWRIISIMSDAARQSLKQKGMPFPPWRKAEYMKCKWLAPYVRECDVGEEVVLKDVSEEEVVVAEWRLPEVRVKSLAEDGRAVVVTTGLASLLKVKP